MAMVPAQIAQVAMVVAQGNNPASPQGQQPPQAAQGNNPASSQGQQPPQAPPPVALSPDDIDQFKRARVFVSFKQAHRFLTELRGRHRDTQDEVFFHDLTDTEEFDWKVWVSQRPDAEDIVGPGIGTFAFVWLASMDTNLHERRGDFMVQRADGLDIRLHPQKNQNRATGLREAVPVRGSWAQEWDPAITPIQQHAALAAAQGHDQIRRIWPTPTYNGVSAADAPSKTQAIWFLNREEVAWQNLPHPRGPFRRDITTVQPPLPASSRGHFHWPYFVEWRSWFQREFRAEGHTITKFEVAWSHGRGHAVFLGERSDGRMFVVNPRAGGQIDELVWEPLRGDICELDD